jgi:SAM-dependent methyltransferase
MSDPTPDFTAIRQRQQQAWATGDFSVVGRAQQVVGEMLVEAVDLRAGSKVLDVACGAGNVAIAAARRYCDVTGLDFVPALLERGRERAQAERVEVEFVEGDAEALPFADASFNVVLSTYGVMFAPNQAKAAAEVLRVCRPGGTIGLGNWTPEGLIGNLFTLTSRYAPSPAGLAPPTRWGTENGLQEVLGDGVTALTITPRAFVYRHPSPEHWVNVFRETFGPVMRAFATLDPAGQESYAADLLQLARRFNRADDGTLVAPADYLEVVATRR